MNKEIENIYQQIENKILNHEIYQNIKDYSKIKEKINTYLDIGKLLKNVETKYGKSVIKEYSNRLSVKFNKKYTTSLLYKIKKFYNIVEKVPTLSGKLTKQEIKNNQNDLTTYFEVEKLLSEVVVIRCHWYHCMQIK